MANNVVFLWRRFVGLISYHSDPPLVGFLVKILMGILGCVCAPLVMNYAFSVNVVARF